MSARDRRNGFWPDGDTVEDAAGAVLQRPGAAAHPEAGRVPSMPSAPCSAVASRGRSCAPSPRNAGVARWLEQDVSVRAAAGSGAMVEAGVTRPDAFRLISGGLSFNRR